MHLKHLGLLLLPLHALAESYIAQLKPESSLEQALDYDDRIEAQTHLRSNVVKSISIGDSFKCFVADLDLETLESLKANPSVKDVSPNIISVAPAVSDVEEVAEGSERRNKDAEPVRNNAKGKNGLVLDSVPDHLARLSSHMPLSQVTTDPPYDYYYQETGKGVAVFVFDGGINVDLPEFEGQASIGKRLNETNLKKSLGTYYAALLGNDVAPDCAIVDIQIITSKGAIVISEIIEGFQFISQHRSKHLVNKAVAVLPFAIPYLQLLNDAVDAAVDTGVVVVAAAGDKKEDVSKYSPASAKKAISVGAINDFTDLITKSSNFGDVSVFSSGFEVIGIDSEGFLTFGSGTGAAASIVAGLTATLLEGGVDATHIKEKIIELSDKGTVKFRNSLAESSTPKRVAANPYGEKI